MLVTSKEWGKLSTGEAVTLYTMTNKNNMTVEVADYGAAIISVNTPDKSGRLANVILGYRDLAGYEGNPSYFGAFVGRNANRIPGAKVTLSGQVWELEKNNGENNLHSGKNGMTFRIFKGEIKDNSVAMTCNVPHLGDGFPGNLECTVTYTLSDDNELSIHYHAVSDQDTVINMTNHSHFNLAGHDSGSIDNQTLEMKAPFFTPNTAECMPTGEILSVKGTAFDFTKAKAFAPDINGGDPQIDLFGGYDHNFVLEGSGLRKFAVAADPASGRVMEAWTDLPAVQLYTCNGLDLKNGRDGAEYKNHQAFCLETQTFPGATDMPWVTSPIYKAGQVYESTTIYRFSSM